ncbi:MAG: hypothetical protein M1831_007129 [Alyxoria varia]|nr:MAG: hypothetical protein M1831_007129 [Alyxoria varia]
MCEQQLTKYTCGCVQPRVFIQCDRLWDLETNIRCMNPTRTFVPCRNYCKGHMPVEGVATREHRGRHWRGPFPLYEAAAVSEDGGGGDVDPDKVGDTGDAKKDGGNGNANNDGENGDRNEK